MQAAPPPQNLPTCSILRLFSEDELEEIHSRLEHTVLCEYEDHEICPVFWCHPMRQLLIHTDHCTERHKTVCEQCKQCIEVVIHHARLCDDIECCMPFCLDLRRVAKPHFPDGYEDKDMEEMVRIMVQEMIYEEDDDEGVIEGRKVKLHTEEMQWDEVLEGNGEWDGKSPRLYVNLDWNMDDYAAYVEEMKRNPPQPKEDHIFDLPLPQAQEEEEEEDEEEEEEMEFESCSESEEEVMMEDWEEGYDVPAL